MTHVEQQLNLVILKLFQGFQTSIDLEVMVEQTTINSRQKLINADKPYQDEITPQIMEKF
jgi:hypothetical protein